MINPSDIYHAGSCGVGFVCNITGEKSYQIVRWGIEAVKNLTHRGAVGADGKTGDGAGVLFQLPKKFFKFLSSPAVDGFFRTKKAFQVTPADLSG